MTQAFLRPEARPLEWRHMSAYQQDAILTLTSFLRSAVREADENPGSDDSLYPKRLSMQTKRSNGVIQLTGDRGTGKTSLLLTLQQELLNPGTEVRGAFHTAPPQLQKQLLELSRRLVWLETLDLEPLPRGTRLLSAIMSRLEAAVKEDRADGCTPRRSESQLLRRPPADPDQVLLDFDQLLADVNLGWDGRDGAAPGVDPDIHARELRRVESARLSVRSRFIRSCDDLANCLPWKTVTNPVFILPVDDMDLNPSRCLELLRLLREFTCQRLLVLVLGNESVARLVLEQSILGEFLTLTHGREKVSEVEVHARRLAGEAMRKLLPPNQRVHLSKLTPAETLAFRPTDQQPTLSNLSGRIVVTYRQPAENPMRPDTTLQDLLVIPAETPEATSRRWPDAARYSGAEILATTFRRVHDMWASLAEAVGWDGKNGLDNIRDEQIRRRFRDYLWSEVAQAWKSEPFATTAESRPDQELVRFVAGAEFPVRGMRFASQMTTLERRRMRVPAGSTLVLKRLDRVILKFVENPERSKVPEISPATTGLVALTHDVLTLGNEQWVHPYLRAPQVAEAGLVELRWQVAGSTRVHVRWRGPRLRTIWEFELFVRRWEHYLQSSPLAPNRSMEPEILKAAMLFWLTLGSAVVLGTETAWQMLDVAGLYAMDEVNTVPLIQQLEKAAHDRQDSLLVASRDNVVETWLCRVAALLTVENGVDSDFAKPFFKSTILTGYWKNPTAAATIRQMRRVAVSPRTDNDLTELLLNPGEFDRRMLRRLKKAARQVAVLIDPSPFKVKIVPPPSRPRTAKTKTETNTPADIRQVAKDMQEMVSTYAGRNVAYSKDRELFERAQTRVIDSPKQNWSETTTPEVLEAVEAAAALARELAEGNGLYTRSAEHIANTFRNGILCRESA